MTKRIAEQHNRIKADAVGSAHVRVRMDAMSMRSGFSLVELLVVVALIVLIISMLLPGLGKAKEEARTIMCLNRMRIFADANYSYAFEHLNWLLPIRGADGSYWMTNDTYREMLGVEATGSDFPQSHRCPSLHPQAVGSGGQTHNFYGWNRTPIGYGDLPITFTRNRVKTPQNKIQIADSTDWHIWRDYANPIGNWDTFRHERLWSVAYRHRETINAAHFDGHISKYTKEEAYPPLVDDRDAIWHIDY